MPAGLLRWTDRMLAGLLGRAAWTTAEPAGQVRRAAAQLTNR